MPELERLAAHHAPAVLRFERENRAYFARYVPDRGDDFFTGYAARHAALLDEQERGTCHFHVLVGDHGAVLGRFNLVDVAGGSAELGYRVAERAAGRGLAGEGVRHVCELARTEYGLRRLVASAALANPASLAVLKRAGFVLDGSVRGDSVHDGSVRSGSVSGCEVDLNGEPGLRHVLDLGAPYAAASP
ncbi:GNAT family N-acetyltransferase [Micromonospora aurantiaca (nom. illeg.)]|uniref:GNAT family N-acetyltransferase n=1 Tax=Micromonospora aurantiaca (nom. illeg.) TaxID=47850 RepID=UPI0001BF3938|nr:GNAT family N-acetyltransferase [Micromonospora aurantiaca]ADL43693.1 GCN5-related N-acetyltransferase [Micromonospora aurantiaca ATCC 27029]